MIFFRLVRRFVLRPLWQGMRRSTLMIAADTVRSAERIRMHMRDGLIESIE